MKEMPKQSRTDLYKTIDPNYFGFRDEEDGVLVASEQKVEQEGEPWSRSVDPLYS